MRSLPASLYGLADIASPLLADGEIEAVFWLLLVVVLLVPVALAALWLRKWAKGEETDDSTGIFVLSDLRQLLKQGKITADEFERLKAEIVTSAKRTAEQPPKGLGDAEDSAPDNLPPFDPSDGNSDNARKPPKR